jgi:drug/metabolite transporter (DMT)-like permease
VTVAAAGSTSGTSRENLRGVAAMLVAVATLSLMDGCLKVLSPHYAPLQVASIRGLSTLPVVLVWVTVSGGFGQLVRVRWPLHVARGLLGIGMLSAFTFGVRHLPLADAYSIFFVAPLLITALAVPILRERVDWRRWLAIGVGFVGVLIVLRPTGASALSAPGLAVLFCALGYALSAITVRILSRTDSTQAMMFWVMFIVGVGAGALAFPSWRPVQDGHWIVILGIAVTGSVGQWAVTEAFRHGEASFVAPFEYTALAWGMGLDWFFWKTVPAPVTLVGAAVIIASGIYLLRRERVHSEAEHP